MAVINPVRSSPSVNIERVFWETLTDADTAAAIIPQGLSGLAGSVQFTGTIGTAITLQGSNDGTNYVTLKDLQGNNISTAAAASFDFSTSMLYIRPGAPTGTSDVDVTVILRSQ